MAYLDKNGLSHLWSKIVNLFNKRIEVSETAPTEEENKIWLQPITTNAGVVDYIVEEGISGIWTYRKWNSGIAECWGTKIASVTTSSSWAGYYTGAIGSIVYPTGLFISAPILNATLKASNFPGHIFIDGYESASETGSMAIAGHDQRTVECRIHMNAKGNWK